MAGGAAKDGEFNRGGWSIVGKRAVVVFTRTGLRMMKPKQLECCRMCRMPVRRRRAWRRSGVEWASLLTKPANNSFSPESDVDIVQDLLQLLLPRHRLHLV